MLSLPSVMGFQASADLMVAARTSIHIAVRFWPTAPVRSRSAKRRCRPIADVRYEAKCIPHCALAPIPSLRGHPAGAAVTPASARFPNDHLAAFMAGPAGESDEPAPPQRCLEPQEYLPHCSHPQKLRSCERRQMLRSHPTRLA
jgi:hypothetical protein